MEVRVNDQSGALPALVARRRWELLAALSSHLLGSNEHIRVFVYEFHLSVNSHTLESPAAPDTWQHLLWS